MRTLPLFGALAFFGLAVQPASAQMCGSPGQQAQASTPSQGMGGMCGGMGAMAEDDPMADKPAEPKQRMSGMCPCCRNMAMMRGGKSGGGMHHDMPGMEQPKQ